MDGNRGLKIIVISMGVMLIGGMVLAMYVAMGKKAQRSEREQAVANGEAICAAQEMALLEGERIAAMKQEDGLIMLNTASNKGGGRALVINGCSGAVNQELRIVPPQ